MTSSKPAILALLVSCGGAAACTMVYDYPSAAEIEAGATCSDGADNDFDGAIDCQDPDCTSECREQGELCHDGIDNDVDGNLDCDDPGCDGFCTEASELRCGDMRDNDGDGLIDEADVGCWPVVGMPQVTRCASTEPVDWVETFNNESAQGFALFDEASISRWDRSPREDLALTGPAGAVATAVSAVLFPATERLMLGFDLSVPEGAILRVMLVSAAEQEAAMPPREDLGSALLAVQVHGGAEGAELQLQTRDSQSNVVTFGATRLTLSLDRNGARVSASGETLAEIDGLNLPPFRLALWSRATDVDNVYVDNVQVLLPGAMPCGRREPQLHATTKGECPSLLPWAKYELGRAVAAARSDQHGACALVLGTERATGTASAVKVYRSSDGGNTWDGPGEDIPPGGDVSGLGVAPVNGGWRAVIGGRDGELRILESTDCMAFSLLGSISEPAARSPSVIVEGANTFVYYLEEGSGPAVWNLKRRLFGDERSAEAEQIAVLGEDLAVSLPATLTQVGRNLVLVYPERTEGRAPALRAAVAAVDAPDRWTVMQVPMIPPTFNNEGFDSAGALAGALLWSGGEGTILYAGRGTPFGLTSSYTNAVMNSVGTARITSGGPSGATLIPVPRCGNGTCNSDEDCEDCPVDCCGDSRMEVLAAVPAEVSLIQDHSYVAPALERAVLTQGGISQVLSRAATSRFDLSFKLDLAPGFLTTGDEETIIGLVPDVTLPDGLFIRTTNGAADCTPGRAALGLLARSGIAEFTGLDSNDGPTWACDGHRIPFSLDAPVFVRLSRTAGIVTLTARDGFGCTLPSSNGPELSVKVPGGLASSPALLAGNDGVTASPVYLSNVVLDTRRCEEPSCSGCVETDSNPDHCGACSARCGAGQFCRSGVCACATRDAEDCSSYCTDKQSDPVNCGACGNACALGDGCVAGKCGGGSCANALDVGSTTDWLKVRFDSALPAPGACGTELPVQVLKWTAPGSGIYNIDTDALVNIQTSCEEEASCDYLFDAQAGVSYFVSLFSADREASIKVAEF